MELMKEKHVIVRCLKELKLNILADDAHTQTNWNVLEKYAKIAIIKALKAKRFDIIESLEFAGLIYV